MPRYKESKRQEMRRDTRAKLLFAAAEAFSRLGYERANVDDISTAAGFAKGTIYNYFASKRAILLALLDEIAAEHNDFVQQAVVAAAAPSERLTTFLEAGFAWVSQKPIRARLMLNILNGPDAELRERIFAAYAPMFRLVSQGVLAAGIENGQFRPLETGQTSSLIMLVYLAVASQTNPQGQPWLPADRVSDLILFGLVAR